MNRYQLTLTEVQGLLISSQISVIITVKHVPRPGFESLTSDLTVHQNELIRQASNI